MRRSFVAVALALVAGASIAQAKEITAAPPAQNPPAAAAPAAQAAPAADPLKFATDDAAIMFQVKPGRGADFEAAYGDLLKAMAASKKPEIVALAGTIKMFKVAAETPADQPSVYLVQITSASKELSYNHGLILYYSGKPQGATYDGIFEKQDDATAIYTRLTEVIAQMFPWPLKRVGG